MNDYNSYVKIGPVGRGAYGVCYACRKIRDENGPPRKVVIKQISIEGMTKKEQDQIKMEAQNLQSLSHPNIIRCYGYQTNETNNDPATFLYIMMHYAEGGTLEQLIRERQGNKYLPEQLIKYYFAQLAQALRYLHFKNIIHRDVKSQNILLNRKRTIVMLGDFGVSKQLNTIEAASTVIGTPYYLSPEMIKNEKYNKKSDLWALGCVLYEMVELHRAFDGEFACIWQKITNGQYREQKNDKTSANIRELISKLLNVDPVQRLDAETVITHPSVLRVCIDITLDLGRVENEIEKLVAEVLLPPPTTQTTLGSPLSGTSRTKSVPLLNLTQSNNNSTIYSRSQIYDPQRTIKM